MNFNMTCCWHKLKWYYGPIISAGRGLMCKPCGSVHLVTHRHQCPQLTTLRHVCVCMHANEMFKEMRGRGWDGGWNEAITWKRDERQHVTDHLKSTTYHIPMYYTDMSHTRVLKHTFPRSGYLVAGGKLQDVCGTSLARNWTPLVLHRGEQDSHMEV